MPSSTTLSWHVGPSATADTPPSTRWPATVPGAVQMDWAAAQGMTTWWHGRQVEAFVGLEDAYWHYESQIPHHALAAGERLLLTLGGVDHAAIIRVGGVERARMTGMHRLLTLDLTGTPAGTALTVVILPAPKEAGRPDDRSQARRTTKAAVSYGWDWHPRLIPLGLCRPVELAIRPGPALTQVDVHTRLDENARRGQVTIEAHWPAIATAGTSTLTAKLTAPDGQLAWTGTASGTAQAQLVASVADPALWWPQGHGPQDRYLLEVVLTDAAGTVLDRRERRIGFRRVRLVMSPGAWERPSDLPKSRSAPPTTLAINGRSIFATGTNIVPPDLFPGRITRATWEPLLRLAAEAHFTLLRVWGGGPAPDEAFYDLCDELGLLVWQEFPLACNEYPDDAAYLRELDDQSRAIIRRGAAHPCLALWCGGNELFNAWSGMTDQSHALRLLGRNCFDLDPDTPFLPTAPLDGMAHGHYLFRDPRDGREVFAIFADGAALHRTAYSEFACPGPASLERLAEIIPEDERFPPKPGTSWQVHHAFGAWDVEPTSWLCVSTLEHYFGPAPDLATLVERGTWLQGEGYQGIYEEARRQKPTCAMALNWCFNEPWPSAAGNHLIAWPATPRPAYAKVQAACRPTLASARILHFQWQAGRDFEADLWLLHNGPAPTAPVTITATLRCGGRDLHLGTWPCPASPANTNQRGPTLRCRLPDDADDDLVLTVAVLEEPGWSSSYRRSVVQGDVAQQRATRAMNG